jgi:sugar/nucleoside kinase (ribokinase family)
VTGRFVVDRAAETLLLGPVSRDRYLESGTELPGGGALNVAWHWQQLGRPFVLLTRLGARDAPAALDLLDRNRIPYAADSIVADGRSAAIDIVIEEDRQPYMDHFVEGVWGTFRLTSDEERSLASARRLHAVLVEGAISELERLAGEGRLRGVEVAADFLGFRHYTVERFERTMSHVAVGFVGWPGAPDDPTVAGFREVAFDLERLVVVTMGARSVHVFDGRSRAQELVIPVTAVPVEGTTLGCGDAFIAHCLDELWRSGDIVAAVERGKAGGALATRWARPLPDGAYPDPQAAEPRGGRDAPDPSPRRARRLRAGRPAAG